MRFVYSPQYDLNLGDHVFPSQKFRLIRERLLAERVAEPEDFLEPEPASDADLLLAHDPGWIKRLKTGTLSYVEILQLEIPWSEEMARAFILAAGGTTLAARRALTERVCYNVGGGFHHAFRAHGEGFCAINDIAVAIKVAQRDGLIHRAMVIDCDVHHGNGTASIFAKDPAVFTISVQQFNNYPAEKPPSTLDIHLKDGTGDEEYLQKLGDGIRFPIAEYRPELVVYVAGADPYQEDQLGGLRLTLDGLKARDELVIGEALKSGAAVAVVLAGGYARRVEDTVTIHCNTAKVAKEMVG
jgi:acetoin utilization deacetylase AcuC-like enzyme